MSDPVADGISMPTCRPDELPSVESQWLPARRADQKWLARAESVHDVNGYLGRSRLCRHGNSSVPNLIRHWPCGRHLVSHRVN